MIDILSDYPIISNLIKFGFAIFIGGFVYFGLLGKKGMLGAQKESVDAKDAVSSQLIIALGAAFVAWAAADLFSTNSVIARILDDFIGFIVPVA